jgi:hypothetical protein
MRKEKKAKYLVSWDIEKDDSNWVVQFWKHDKDGTKTLIWQLDKNSDGSGSFDLDFLTPSRPY